jgi:hypothetical protein
MDLSVFVSRFSEGFAHDLFGGTGDGLPMLT